MKTTKEIIAFLESQILSCEEDGDWDTAATFQEVLDFINSKEDDES